MFSKRSRYYQVDTASVTDRSGREISAVKLRRLGSPNGAGVRTTSSDQLDVMSEQAYKDSARFWHIADANTELEANSLVETEGRYINVAEK